MGSGGTYGTHVDFCFEKSTSEEEKRSCVVKCTSAHLNLCTSFCYRGLSNFIQMAPQDKTRTHTAQYFTLIDGTLLCSSQL